MDCLPLYRTYEQRIFAECLNEDWFISFAFCQLSFSCFTLIT